MSSTLQRAPLVPTPEPLENNSQRDRCDILSPLKRMRGAGDSWQAGATWVFSPLWWHFHSSGLRMIKGRGQMEVGAKGQAGERRPFEGLFLIKHLQSVFFFLKSAF